jgi:hypothetical protein
MKKTLDLHYRSEIPLAKSLSNLYPYNFIMDGYSISSMEAFLQSLKVRDLEEKKKIWEMYGVKCWKYGQQFNSWKETQILYDNFGNPIDRHSKEYEFLIQRAYDCWFKNEEFKSRLKESLPYKVTHSMGKTDKTDSVLTKDEYIGNMDRLRDKLRERRFFNLFGW